MRIKDKLEGLRNVRDEISGAWENREAVRDEAIRAWNELPDKWRGRDAKQSLTLIVVVVSVIVIIAMTVA